MPEFFDHLWELLQNPRSQRDRARYIEQLRTLIPESPPVRRLEVGKNFTLGWAERLIGPPETLSFQSDVAELFLLNLQQDEAEPLWFRQIKDREPQRPIWRTDPVRDEVQVLETRAMGADGYCLPMRELDLAAAQFLCEVGRDYAIPAVACCASEEELARAVLLRDLEIFWLSDELVQPSLLELPWFEGKHVLFEVQMPFDLEAFRGTWPTNISLLVT